MAKSTVTIDVRNLDVVKEHIGSLLCQLEEERLVIRELSITLTESNRAHKARIAELEAENERLHKHNEELGEDWTKMFEEGDHFLESLSLSINYPGDRDLDFENLKQFVVALANENVVLRSLLPQEEPQTYATTGADIVLNHEKPAGGQNRFVAIRKLTQKDCDDILAFALKRSAEILGGKDDDETGEFSVR